MSAHTVLKTDKGTFNITTDATSIAVATGPLVMNNDNRTFNYAQPRADEPARRRAQSATADPADESSESELESDDCSEQTTHTYYATRGGVGLVMGSVKVVEHK